MTVDEALWNDPGSNSGTPWEPNVAASCRPELLQVNRPVSGDVSADLNSRQL